MVQHSIQEPTDTAMTSFGRGVQNAAYERGPSVEAILHSYSYVGMCRASGDGWYLLP